MTLLDSVPGYYPYELGPVTGVGATVRAAASMGAGGAAVGGVGMQDKDTIPTAAGGVHIGGAWCRCLGWRARSGRRYRTSAPHRCLSAGVDRGAGDGHGWPGSTIDATALVADNDTIATATGDEAGGNVVLLAPQPTTGRYLRIDLAGSGGMSRSLLKWAKPAPLYRDVMRQRSAVQEQA